MATIAEQLTSLANTKTAIKDAIVAKGVSVADTDPFSAYPAKIGEIQGGGAPATKFGLTIDAFLGDVDENGNLYSPEELVELDLTGVTVITSSCFCYKFYTNRTVCRVIANDATTIATDAFRACFNYGTIPIVLEFNGIETVVGSNVFAYICGDVDFVDASFNSLKKVTGQRAFDSAFSGAKIEPDAAFPVLEEITGSNAFASFRKFSANDVVVFSALKKMTGNSSVYSGVFGSLYTKNTVWHFPRVTEITKNILNMSSSYPGEIHFAAANQAALEACDGYANKWGASGATIYFDLMLTITVNGVTYSRDKTIGGYTSWADESGNIVYTNATAEPAVGTAVYSDQGTTQVGTVEGVA